MIERDREPAADETSPEANDDPVERPAAAAREPTSGDAATTGRNADIDRLFDDDSPR